MSEEEHLLLLVGGLYSMSATSVHVPQSQVAADYDRNYKFQLPTQQPRGLVCRRLRLVEVEATLTLLLLIAAAVAAASH